MFGFILMSFGTSLEELSALFSKKNVQSGKLGIYGLITLNVSISLGIFIAASLLWPKSFFFSLLSLPFFLLRACLEIAQIHYSTKALVLADRTTFSFVRTLTIPLLLFADILIGYSLSQKQVIGVIILTGVLLSVFIGKRFSKKAIGPVLFSAINAVLTISLFKYDISHFNSIAAEQIGILTIILIYAILCRAAYGESDPFPLIQKDKKILLQVMANGIGGVLQNYSYSYLLPSITTAVKRSAGVFWALLSGRYAFHEQHILWKAAIMLLLVLSLTLLMQGS